LLTDDEMGRRPDWAGYPDPFGDWHEDPCDELSEPAGDIATSGTHEGDEP
jgi:hypothetical protein